MPINFTQIIRDSWNFIRNEKRMVITLSLLFFVANFCIALFTSSLLPEETITITMDSNGMPNIPEEMVSGLIGAFTIKQLGYIFLSAWFVVIIHQISQRRFMGLSDCFLAALKRIIGVTILFVAILIPMLIGLLESLIAVQQKTEPSIISVLAIIFGIGLYVRLCLSPIHYLLTNASIGSSLQTVLRAGSERASQLFILCLLIYVVLPMGEAFLLRLSANIFMSILMGMFDAFLNVFALIIIYRFYTLFVPRDEN
ncbi:beta-methylgalactoside transporter [Aggregatibacter kilianii]|uniref:beta-methylgalactoside transporter n=1 Tax=Aggregatibacter kilianii TaxID=2025884 RepID=UPI000D642AC0|nr:beta-methylgalactoside transporter [Aggregatibacter kilianii]